ncbi:MAG: hypothetical protein AAGJ08_00400 [Cyanobacteria bacterium P01_H01_bin.35]
MIQKLINQIKTELETELNDLISKLEIILYYPTQEIDKDVSRIAIYPGKLTINQKFKDTILSQKETKEISQEFQQELSINICDSDRENVEKITSLVTAIILTNQNEFYQTTTTKYNSKTISNTQTISQISLIEGLYISQQNPFVFQLKFDAISLMKIVKTVTDDTIESIKEIELKSTMGNSLPSDKQATR